MAEDVRHQADGGAGAESPMHKGPDDRGNEAVDAKVNPWVVDYHEGDYRRDSHDNQSYNSGLADKEAEGSQHVADAQNRGTFYQELVDASAGKQHSVTKKAEAVVARDVEELVESVG